MVHVQEALEIILNEFLPGPAEEVLLEEALGRVLAEEVLSSLNLPPLPSSAMDGYAVIAEDTRGAAKGSSVTLQLIEDLPAGKIPEKAVTKGLASRIMTGGVVPEGANAVVVVEETRLDHGRVEIFAEVEKGENVREAGEDVKEGEVVLERGRSITPACLGMLASLGRSRVRVYRRPVVAILSTGDELLEPGEELRPGKIRNSNSYSLYGLVLKSGGIPLLLGIAKDERESIHEKVREGLERGDLLLTTAGVSGGERDLVKDVMREAGVLQLFWKVAMKPGMPLAFGVFPSPESLQGKGVFGLPGNPVSCMVTFLEFVYPVLQKMLGRSPLTLPECTASMAEDYVKKPGKTHFLRGVLQREGSVPEEADLTVRTTGPQGSGILKSLVQADCLIVVPSEAARLRKGERVRVQLLP